MARRRTKAEWQTLVTQFDTSGQSAKAFCLAQGISSSNFFKRRQEVRGSAASSFVPAKVTTGHTGTVVIQVSGATIRCDSNTPTAWLAELVDTLSA